MVGAGLRECSSAFHEGTGRWPQNLLLVLMVVAGAPSGLLVQRMPSQSRLAWPMGTKTEAGKQLVNMATAMARGYGRAVAAVLTAAQVDGDAGGGLGIEKGREE